MLKAIRLDDVDQDDPNEGFEDEDELRDASVCLEPPRQKEAPVLALPSPNVTSDPFDIFAVVLETNYQTLAGNTAQQNVKTKQAKLKTPHAPEKKTSDQELELFVPLKAAKAPKKAKTKKTKETHMRKPAASQKKLDAPKPTSNMKKPAASEPSAAPKTKNEAPGCYKPGEYKKARDEFIDNRKQDGDTYKEACAAWDTCSIKKRLLGTLPLAELKRRKFVGKDATSNPWSCPEDEVAENID